MKQFVKYFTITAKSSFNYDEDFEFIAWFILFIDGLHTRDESGAQTATAVRNNSDWRTVGEIDRLCSILSFPGLTNRHKIVIL